MVAISIYRGDCALERQRVTNMTFTTDNTAGYTAAELAALNVELAAVRARIAADDVEALAEAEDAFADQVARR
jgi:hypothetical protein